ncbi:MAG: DUF2799 domain-containing protein [Burkholderiales bacterium]
MMRPVLASIAAAAVLALAGCATIPEQDCPKVDWYELGLKDGRAGYPPERIADHREACKGAKVEPDELKYLQGRKAGIDEYCQPPNAFRDGLAGNEYRGVCDATFARNHAAALRVATLRRAIERNRGDISWRESEIRSDKTSDSRRQQLRNDVRDLDYQRGALREDLARAERDLDRLMAQQPPAPAAAPPPPAAPKPPPAVPVGPAGTAAGTLVVDGVTMPLRFAYTFVAPDALDKLAKRPMLLLTQDPIPPAAIGAAEDLDRVLASLPAYVLVSRNEATPPKIAMIVWHAKLGAAPAVEKDAGKSGVARLDAYGPQRIAGRLASPGNGKNPYAWNKAIRLDVKFDAPLARGW